MADNEAFYDAEIAPALADLNRRCQERGMSFFAAVAYDDAGSVGRTVNLRENAPGMLRFLDVLGRCWCKGGAVNIDSFMMAVQRDAMEKGHSSAVLHLLGVPTKPGGPKPFNPS